MTTKTKVHKLMAYILTIAMIITFTQPVSSEGIGGGSGLPVITEITFNSDSTAYDSATNTFCINAENPLVLTVTGKNMLGQNMRFLVANANVDAVYADVTSTGDETFTYTVDEDYYRLIMESFEASNYEAKIAYVGICFADESPSMDDLVALNVTRKSYTVTVNTASNGTVTADKENAAEGETVTLTIVPATGYELDTLTVKDADNGNVTVTDNTFTMPAKAVTVTATFAEICDHSGSEHTSVNDNGDGTHSFECTLCGGTGSENHSFGSGNTCDCGIEIKVTGMSLTADTEYRYDAVTDTYTVVMVPGDSYADVTVKFNGENLKYLTEENTMLLFERDDNIFPDPYTTSIYRLKNYDFGTTWNIRLTPENPRVWFTHRYTNDGGTTWSGKLRYEVVQAYSITASGSENGTVSIEGNKTYAIEGEIVTLTVTPDSGYIFDTLTVDGNDVTDEVNEGEYTFDMPENDVTITATFRPDQRVINLSARPAEGGTVTGGGTYLVGTDVTVTATANEGYVFDGWYEADIYKSSDASYTFTLTENRELVAKFAKLYTVTYHANDGTGGTSTATATEGESFYPTDGGLTYLTCRITHWNTEADGSGYSYNIGEEIEDVSSDIDLYAFWELPLYEMDSFSGESYEWSGNDSAPYTFTMKNGAVLYASIVLPLESAEEESVITVDGDCEIKGSISFEGSQRAVLTVKGDGSLKCANIDSTANGDTLKVETEMAVENNLDLGASGGMNSNLIVKDATLTVNGNVVLLQHLTMTGDAKLNISGGHFSFHGYPEINLSNDSEIVITGTGHECVLYKEPGNNDAFDAWMHNKWLPEGYNFADENGNYYLCDAENRTETFGVIIKKAPSTSRPSGGGGSSRYTVKFETNGGSSIDSQSIVRNGKVTEPEEPKKDGSRFEGWYTDTALTLAYNFETKVTKGFTLYAKWSETEDKNGSSGHNCPSIKFKDLDISQWYHLDTDYVIENDIFRGTTENTFEPHSNITRAMMITVLYRAEGEPEVTGEASFEDTDKNAYYAKAVIWGQQNGIIKGYSDTVYAPEQNILREQIAAILYRYAKYKGYDVSVGENTNILSYDDFESISEYAIPAMQWAVGSGMIKGRSESTLNPSESATRVEIAAMLHRFIENNK